MEKIVKIIKRHHYGCFTVEDANGDWFLVQLQDKLEKLWNSRKTAE